MRNPIKQIFNRTRGFFETFKTVTPKHDRPEWGTFDFYKYSKQNQQLYLGNPDIKACVLTIAGVGVAEGLFVKPAKDNENAQKAADECDKLNKRVRMRKKIYNTFLRLVKYGTCFWEKDWQSVHGLDLQLIPHQEYMKPRFNKTSGAVDAWEYEVHGTAQHTWAPDGLGLFAVDVEQYAPYGTSLLIGIENELETKKHISDALKAYLEKQAWASNVLQVGDGQFMPNDTQVQTIESRVKNREVGEDFVTNYPIDLKVMGAASIETRMVPDALAFAQERISDALLVPPISKLYNSTEASAKVLVDWCRAVIIQPLQMVIKEVIEEQIYQPYLLDKGYSVTTIPELAFEPPDKWIRQMAEELNLVELVGAGIVSQRTAAQLLGLGEEYERDNMEEKNKQQMQAQQQAQQASGQQPQEEEPKAEEWIVRRRSRRDS